jgi:electron transfer flavoprotein alpha subunit
MAILVFIEQRGGRVRSVAREALGEAVRLAAELGGPVVGVCAAASDPGLAALREAGASETLLAAHDAFAHYEPSGYAAAVVAAVERVKPSLVLFSASSMGRDLAPRVAARLGVGLAADCTALTVEGGRLIASRPVYAGKAVQRVAFTGTPALVSLRPKVFAPAPPQNGAAPVVTPLPASCTQPAFSWPRTRGSVTPAGSMSPSMACRSVAQTPAPPMRTTTSVGCRGSGTGRSTNSSGW